MTDTYPACESLELVFCELHGGSGLRWVPATPARDWMDKTGHRNAYHCLPMLMANSFGWLLLNNACVRSRWDGSADAAGIEFDYADPAVAAAATQARIDGTGAFISGSRRFRTAISAAASSLGSCHF